MKNNIKYIKRIGIFVLALVVAAACVKWEEETSPSMDSASTVTLGISSVGDSSVVISYSNSSDGYVALNLFEGTGNTVPIDLEDREAMLTGNVVSMDYFTGETSAGETYEVTFGGLVQDASYEVMGVANNADGIVSEVVVQVVNTADSHPPVLTGTDPENATVGLPVGGPIVLIFDEPVLYDDTKDLVFTELLDAEDVIAGSVTVDNNMVTVTPGEDFTNYDVAMLSYPEGAFTDLAGNLTAEMDSYYDAGFYGLFWEVESMEFEAISIAPEEAVVPTGFDIVVGFAQALDITGVGDGDITLTYDDGVDILIKSVMASEVSAAGNDLTISQSYNAPPGVEVTLDIPAELFEVGYGNPNAEVTATWNIELTLSDLVGNYTVNAVSYANPGAYDEVWTATVAEVPGNDTALSIVIDAGIGGGIPFLAKFDVDAWEVVITAGTEAGDLYGYGRTVMYESDMTYIDGSAPIMGSIAGGSGFNIDLLGMYLPDYDWGDGTYGAIWDAFNTTWTKSATKAAVSGGSIDPSKISRTPRFK